MSLRNLNTQLQHFSATTVEKIVDIVESTGLDPDAPEVLESVQQWFGPELRDLYEEEIR